ncbi:MAG TPA: hypothetical protein ENI19_03085 [Candidatus Nealsonbacteria bacterium]|uniref:Uncharacterized protein n=1 Tax=marine sediment metagenome TaxID=412755 RepID=A0A0F9UF48_9ZZZZ|nr:hypothetical protein [Candidatus Nealsonbacteria bacterium]HEB46664.1 hypothetical protein [Candidatus Nealsonbacteria bacterium]
MKRTIRNNLEHFLIIFIIFLMVAGWIFSGWPKIWQNPPIPPEVKKTQAQSAITLTPDADLATGTWGLTPLFSKVNEDIDSPDGITISTTSRKDTVKFGLTDSSADVGTVTAINIRVRISATPDTYHNLDTFVKSSDGAITFASFSFDSLSPTMTSLTSGDIAVSMTKAQMDDAIFEIKSADKGKADPGDWVIDATNLDITYTPTAIFPATWREIEDTPTSGVNKNENIRLRIEVANTGSEAIDYDYLLEYASKVGAACGDDESFSVVPLSPTIEHFVMSTSTYVADGQDVTAQLQNLEEYTFVTGQIVADPSNSSGNITLSFENYTEIEFVFQATVNATDGGSYCFRVTNAGVVLDEYSVFPELQIAGP